MTGPAFTPPLYWYKATMKRVIDGDTIVVDIDYGFDQWERDARIRLLAIDAPEMRGDEAEAGQKSKQRLIEILPPPGGMVYLKTDYDKTDGWDRKLADVFLADGTYVNNKMVEEGFAEPWEH